MFQNENDEFVVPYEAELECKQHVVVYDSNTRSLKEEGKRARQNHAHPELG